MCCGVRENKWSARNPTVNTMTRLIAAAAIENPSVPIAFTQSGEKITPPTLPPLYAIARAAGRVRTNQGETSERRWHLAGAVGAAICARSFTDGWIRRMDGTQAVMITVKGLRVFRSNSEQISSSRCSARCLRRVNHAGSRTGCQRSLYPSARPLSDLRSTRHSNLAVPLTSPAGTRGPVLPTRPASRTAAGARSCREARGANRQAPVVDVHAQVVRDVVAARVIQALGGGPPASCRPSAGFKVCERRRRSPRWVPEGRNNSQTDRTQLRLFGRGARHAHFVLEASACRSCPEHRVDEARGPRRIDQSTNASNCECKQCLLEIQNNRKALP